MWCVCVCFAVCVYINHGCHCGHALVSHRVAQLPQKFGPSSICRVLRQAVQGLVNCSAGGDSVFSHIPDGHGRVFISGKPSSIDFEFVRLSS